MSRYSLRLYSDRLEARSEFALPEAIRVVYVVEGAVKLRSGGQAACLAPSSAWYSTTACVLAVGNHGAVLRRFELTALNEEMAFAGAGSLLTRESVVELDDSGDYLIRCDRVDFPLGGIAYTHTHRGPGIRCLLSGAIRVEVSGAAQEIGTDEAWFEAGPDPVLAQASETTLTGFVRCMILPRELKGKSSIRYVKPEDGDKPKLQTYQIFIDEIIADHRRIAGHLE